MWFNCSNFKPLIYLTEHSCFNNWGDYKSNWISTNQMMGKSRVPRTKPLRAEDQQTQPTCDGRSGDQIEPHWWKASALYLHQPCSLYIPVMFKFSCQVNWLQTFSWTNLIGMCSHSIKSILVSFIVVGTGNQARDNTIMLIVLDGQNQFQIRSLGCQLIEKTKITWGIHSSLNN